MFKGKNRIFWSVPLAFFLPFFPAFSQSSAGPTLEAAQTASGYEKVVDAVIFEYATAEQMRETLNGFRRTWGLFPSLEYLEVEGPSREKSALVLRGYETDVALAKQIAQSLDQIFPPVSFQIVLSPVPLEHLRAVSMREKLLNLARASGLGLREVQLLIFPPGGKGSLFFLGTAADAKKIKELANSLDQPHYGSLRDSGIKFLRIFRKDLAGHFLAVSTYVVSALLLILLHFLLIKIPWLGKYYEKGFTLIWTKVLDGVKGRDFALEVIKSIAVTAVLSVEQQVAGEVKQGLKLPAEVRSEEKKKQAYELAANILRYRGFNPDDPEIKKIVESTIEAEVLELKRGTLEQ